jgi:hypothetical protein
MISGVHKISKTNIQFQQHNIMKIYLFLFLFSSLFSTNIIAQQNYKDNILSDKSLYAGVYEGYLDISLCCDMYETGFGTIIFYYDGESLKCLYDGLIYSSLSLSDNVIKDPDAYEDKPVFGKFVKGEDEGFLYFFEESDEHPVGSSSFLKKIGDSEMAGKIYLEAEKELNEFKEFENVFRKAFANKNEKEILTMFNIPFYDKRKNWDNPIEYSKGNDVKGLVKTMLDVNLFENSHKYQNTDNNFSGTYTIQGDKMFFYFKKIGTEFKLVFITGVFG